MTSLFNRVVFRFTRRNVNVIMMEDFPSVGFEGQVVQVKPGFARQTLIPKNLAVYDFPGVRARLFPNIQQSEIDTKTKYYRELLAFQHKVESISLEYIKAPSFANPALLKEEISKKDIIKEVQSKHGIELKNENIVLEENIARFGTYSVEVKDLFNVDLQKKFNFELDVQVKQPVIRELKDGEADGQSKDGKKGKESKQKTEGKKDQKKEAKDSAASGKGSKSAAKK